ncbi:hypothetical protein DDE01_11760 [Desulfovibrio desulfuricans]|nr:hypothetical protein DDE01_11760 [Desulfovibrio desulfuricans]
MTFLDVCAGIGGFSLGLERAGMTCAGQVEIDDYCNRVLAKHWPGVPRWRDIKALDCTQLPAVDLICGGYPCQPFSLAGKRRGAEDDRHLWPHLFAVVSALRPAWCLFENVAGHISMGLDAVLSDLERGGYAAQPLVIPACAVDAPHRRDRVWVVANAHAQRELEQERPYADVWGRAIHHNWREAWPIRPRGVHGVSERMAGYLGNAVVPQVVEVIGRAIVAAHEDTHR